MTQLTLASAGKTDPHDGPRGPRPHLVLLAGLLCDDTVWRGAADALADAATMQLLSFPGFSSLGDMAEHVIERLPATPTAVVLAGHSMGGRVALEIVRRWPERVAALALLNTGAHPRREPEVEGRRELVRLACSAGMERLAQAWLPPMMGANAARVAEVTPGLMAMVQRNSPESFAAQTEALLNRPDARRVLEAMRAPTVLLSGSADKWSPLEQHAEMLRHLPEDARLACIHDAGHMAPVEQPEAVARVLRSLLGRVAAEHA